MFDPKCYRALLRQTSSFNHFVPHFRLKACVSVVLLSMSLAGVEAVLTTGNWTQVAIEKASLGRLKAGVVPLFGRLI